MLSNYSFTIGCLFWPLWSVFCLSLVGHKLGSYWSSRLAVICLFITTGLAIYNFVFIGFQHLKIIVPLFDCFQINIYVPKYPLYGMELVSYVMNWLNFLLLAKSLEFTALVILLINVTAITSFFFYLLTILNRDNKVVLVAKRKLSLVYIEGYSKVLKGTQKRFMSSESSKLTWTSAFIRKTLLNGYCFLGFNNGNLITGFVIIASTVSSIILINVYVMFKSLLLMQLYIIITLTVLLLFSLYLIIFHTKNDSEEIFMSNIAKIILIFLLVLTFVGSPLFIQLWWLLVGIPIASTSSHPDEVVEVASIKKEPEGLQLTTTNFNDTGSRFNEQYTFPKRMLFEDTLVTQVEKNNILLVRHLNALQHQIDEANWDLELSKQTQLVELAQEKKNQDIAAEVKLRNEELLKLRVFAEEQVILRNNIAQLQSLLQNESESIQLEKLQLAKQEHCMLSLVTKLQGASYSILSSQDTTPAERILASEKLLSRLSFCKDVSLRLEQEGNSLTQRDKLHQVDLENFNSHFAHLIKESSLTEGKRNNAPVL